jgi:outer membrane lipoprotein-sorting protein
VSASAIFSRYRVLRWVVPVGVAGAVGLVAGGAFSAQAVDQLPPRTASQLLADLQTSKVDGLYGTVVQRSSLGLPELPNIGGSAGTGSLTDLLSGSHTARVWYAGDTKQRIAVMDSVNETDVFRNGDQVWQWSSATKTATHTQLPPGAAGAGRPTPTLTPDEVARRALAALDPTTIVQTDNDKTVAGRAAYELVLVPRAAGSRIGAVHIAIDAQHKVPLGVQIYARGEDPSVAIDVSFTDINFTVPGNDNFTFTPPKGAQVKEQPLNLSANRAGRAAAESVLRPEVVGTGWTSVVVLHTPDMVPGVGPNARAEGSARQLLNALTPVSGAWGKGRLLDSKLLSILITDDGRVLAGAVDPSALYTVAATHK